MAKGTKLDFSGQHIYVGMLGANKLSCIVARNLSGLEVTLEVTDETDRDTTGDPEDAI